MTKEEKIEHWRTIIDRHTGSGKSIADFCRDNKIVPHQFHWWRRRFRNENSNQNGSRFLQLVPVSKSRHSGVRIRMNNSLSIEVEQGFDPKTLRSVIDTIGGETIS